MHSIRMVIFDLDGVLILGSNQKYLNCHHHALRSVGIEISREEQEAHLLDHWSQPHTFQLRKLIPEDEERFRIACKGYEDCLFSPDFFKGVQALPRAKGLLSYLVDNGIRLAIATGMHRKQIHAAFERFHLDLSFFEAIVSGYEIEDGDLQKPHPYMIRKILRDRRVSADSVLYVGDSKVDIRMAKRAGVLSVAVLTGHLDQEQASLEKPTFIIADATRLPALLAL